MAALVPSITSIRRNSSLSVRFIADAACSEVERISGGAVRAVVSHAAPARTGERDLHRSPSFFERAAMDLDKGLGD